MFIFIFVKILALYLLLIANTLHILLLSTVYLEPDIHNNYIIFIHLVSLYFMWRVMLIS